MKSIHILLPGLDPDFGLDTPATAEDAAVPVRGALARLIRRGRIRPLEARGPSPRLAELFGLSAAEDGDAPLAPLRLEMSGDDPGDAYWLCADPVHMLAMLDHLRLGEGATLAIQPDEADALTASLNAHFAGEIVFVPSHPARWHARFTRPIRAATAPLDTVAGESVLPHLPRGPEGARLRAILNEIQMLLFEHPVNQARAERGLPAVNSLWFWGGGQRPASVHASFDRVHADDVLSQALAHAAGIESLPLPVPLDAGAIRPGRSLLVATALDRPARYGPAESWRETLRRIDASLFAPLLALLRRGRIDRLRIDAPGPRPLARELTPLDAWRIWR